MSSAISTNTPLPSRPRLRLIADRGLRAPADQPSLLCTAPRLLQRDQYPHRTGGQDPQPAGVLVAGEDETARARMLDELRGLLPEGTPFLEARETWQVLARVAESRMVILTGDLGDISARGLMRVLSRRHPLLPVIALGLRQGARAPADLDAASL